MPLLKKTKFTKSYFIVGIVVLFAIMILSVNLGMADISYKQTAKIILNKLPFIGNLISIKGINEGYQLIIINLRLPRILMAALVGAGLSVVGTSYQGIFKNPMADPYVLGISSGAAFGATLAIISGLQIHILGVGLTTFCAFIGAIVTTLVVYNIARVGNKIPSVTLLLAGIALSYLLSAAISLIMIFNRDEIEKIVMWTMGNLASASWSEVLILTVLIGVCILVVYFFAKDLNLMLLGDESAKNLGVEVDKVKRIIMFVATLIVAGAVSFSGIIGFVGLIIPHTIRLLFGPDHKVVIPFSALGGAIFLIICDTIARTIAPPAEIPVGIITSLFGVPFFLYLLYKSKRNVM
jgi:iron complex transport system permease protein